MSQPRHIQGVASKPTTDAQALANNIAVVFSLFRSADVSGFCEAQSSREVSTATCRNALRERFVNDRAAVRTVRCAHSRHVRV